MRPWTRRSAGAGWRSGAGGNGGIESPGRDDVPTCGGGMPSLGRVRSSPIADGMPASNPMLARHAVSRGARLPTAALFVVEDLDLGRRIDDRDLRTTAATWRDRRRRLGAARSPDVPATRRMASRYDATVTLGSATGARGHRDGRGSRRRSGLSMRRRTVPRGGDEAVRPCCQQTASGLLPRSAVFVPRLPWRGGAVLFRLGDRDRRRQTVRARQYEAPGTASERVRRSSIRRSAERDLASTSSSRLRWIGRTRSPAAAARAPASPSACRRSTDRSCRRTCAA